MDKLVTFGFVNCNRLHYLRACVRSLLACTKDYPNKELIIVDNASVEEGTQEFLYELENYVNDDVVRVVVHRNEIRDPANEFAHGLNYVYQHARGEYICPLQADIQFVVNGGWLHEYVSFLDNLTGQATAILLDAQRRVTNERHTFVELDNHDGKLKFYAVPSRSPMPTAGDVFYPRKMLDYFAPWSTNNQEHEGSCDSETEMLDRVKLFVSKHNVELFTVQPNITPAIAIYTDPRGTNARVRGNCRYGEYWPPKEGDYYYSLHNLSELAKSRISAVTPISIEEIARPIGFNAPLDSDGNWCKNPIRPESATASEWVSLGYDYLEPGFKKTYVDDWLTAD